MYRSCEVERRPPRSEVIIIMMYLDQLQGELLDWSSRVSILSIEVPAGNHMVSIKKSWTLTLHPRVERNLILSIPCLLGAGDDRHMSRVDCLVNSFWI